MQQQQQEQQQQQQGMGLCFASAAAAAATTTTTAAATTTTTAAATIVVVVAAAAAALRPLPLVGWRRGPRGALMQEESEVLYKQRALLLQLLQRQRADIPRGILLTPKP